MLDGDFGVFQQQHAPVNYDNIGNDNVEDSVDNDENIGNNNVGNVDNGAGIEYNQDVSEEDPLPGGSRRRSREEDEEDEERSRKQFQWWDEFADSDSDCGSDSDSDSTGDDYMECTGIIPVQHAGAFVKVNQHVGEEDQLPGGSNKRSREDERGGQKSRQWDEFADINTDTVSDTDNSERDDLFEDAVEEEDPLPGGSRKRSREEDEEEDGRAGTQFRS